MDGNAFLSQDVNSDCSFADLLIRRPMVSDRSIDVVESQAPRLKTTKKPWSRAESEQLECLFYDGHRVSTIAETLGRTLSSVEGQIRKLKLTRFKNLSPKDVEYLKRNYWIQDVDAIAKKLLRQPATIRYFAKRLGLTKPKISDSEPPIPRTLLPYDMVKRVSVLERNCPFSKNRVEDSVVIFYDKLGPSTPMMAIHLDELCAALDSYFGRRAGVTAGALTHGFKAV